MYDYATPGAYFVTVCTYDHACLFGDVVDGQMAVNAYGEIVREEWFRAAEVRHSVILHRDDVVVMPNHIHGIIHITVGATHRSPLRDHVAAPYNVPPVFAR